MSKTIEQEISKLAEIIEERINRRLGWNSFQLATLIVNEKVQWCKPHVVEAPVKSIDREAEELALALAEKYRGHRHEAVAALYKEFAEFVIKDQGYRKSPVVEAGEGVWPKKKKIATMVDSPLYVWEDGYNFCHDAFTTILKQKGLL